ncbi:MAG: phage major capsid protein [Pirellulales bacterium]
MESAEYLKAHAVDPQWRNAAGAAALALQKDLARETGDDGPDARDAKLNAARTQADAIDSLAGKLVDRIGGRALPAQQVGPDPDEVFAAGWKARNLSQGDANMSRVKEPSERFVGERLIGKHVRTGEIVLDANRKPVCLPSESDFAKIGAFIKHRAVRSGFDVNIPEHERELYKEMLDNDVWVGQHGGEWGAFKGASVKAVLNESGGSGGAGLVPRVFDDAIVQFPLLHSELLPYIDLKDVPRGATIDTASINAPTLTWSGGPEGTAFSLFNTANMVAAISTSIFAVVCGVEFGRDLLADSAVNVGETIADAIGQRLLQELDRVIAYGDGTTEPQGIFLASGTTTVPQQSPSPTGWDVTDVEALLFGLAKQYRANKGPSVRFVMNDTTYRRIRSLAISASDQRRMFGMTHEDYMLFNRPVSINANVPNTKCAFVDLSKYRMYRRLGAESRFTQEGQTLALKNTALLTFRGRYGGKLMDGSAMAQLITAPA